MKKATPSLEKAIDTEGGVFTCVRFHVCKCICMCKCVYACLETLGVVSQVFSTLSFEMRFLIDLVLTNWARLAGSDPLAPGIHLSLPLRCWEKKSTHQHAPLFMWVLGPELRSSCLQDKHLTDYAVSLTLT